MMSSFEITFFITPEVNRDEDIEIIKLVEASDEDEALELARRKLRAENPEIDLAEAKSWFIERKQS